MKKLITDKKEAIKAIKAAKIIICDVDGTVTEDLKPLSASMCTSMYLQNKHEKLLIFMSGTNIAELKRMISDYIWFTHILCGSSGAHIVLVADAHNEVELKNIIIPLEERKLIKKCLEETIKKFNLPRISDQILDRESQVTLSCIGRYADSTIKNNFDPNGYKRLEMVEYIKQFLPNYSIKVGGTTSIDILKDNFDKAKGIKLLMSLMDGITEESTIFIGDKLFEGGNDYPALQVLNSVQVKDPNELIGLFALSLL